MQITTRPEGMRSPSSGLKKTHGEMIEEITAKGQGHPKNGGDLRPDSPGQPDLRAASLPSAPGGPYVLTFGTAWGLSGEYARAADYQLDPITGGTNYNHLSVRSAASIIVDRLLGGSREQHQHTDMVE